MERVLIHYEPVARTHIHYAIPLADPEGRLSEHFGEAPYFALVTVRLADGAVEKKQEVVPNPHRGVEKRQRASGWQSGWWRRRWIGCCWRRVCKEGAGVRLC